MSVVTSRADPQDVQLLDLETLDPNKQYRWVTNTPLAISARISKGYRLVSASADGVDTLIDNGKSPDDNIYNGDSVLMCCDKALYEARRKQVERVSEGRLGSPVETFKSQHGRAGARGSKVVIDDEGE